jgi:hypothetical protein
MLAQANGLGLVAMTTTSPNGQRCEAFFLEKIGVSIVGQM